MGRGVIEEDVQLSLGSTLFTLCILGPRDASGLCRGGCAFVIFELGGGERVGYFRAVLVAGSLAAAFADLDVEEPILVLCCI